MFQDQDRILLVLKPTNPCHKGFKKLDKKELDQDLDLAQSELPPPICRDQHKDSPDKLSIKQVLLDLDIDQEPDMP
jgi:hypothetical protein